MTHGFMRLANRCVLFSFTFHVRGRIAGCINSSALRLKVLIQMDNLFRQFSARPRSPSVVAQIKAGVTCGTNNECIDVGVCLTLFIDQRVNRERRLKETHTPASTSRKQLLRQSKSAWPSDSIPSEKTI